MTDVEELLRAALSEIPAPAAPMTDPLSALDRRVHRARRRMAVAAAAAGVAVIAAVVVPLTVTGRGAHDGLQVGQTPAPLTTNAPGVTTVSAPGPVLSVSTSSTGTVYAVGSWQVPSGAAFLGVVKGNQLTDLATVPGPAQQVIAAERTPGGALAYVIGTDRSTGQSSLTAVYTLGGGASSGGTTGAGPLPGRAVAATAADHSLYVLIASPQGMEVDRYVGNKAGMGQVDFHPIAYASRLVTDAAGHAWVQTDKQLIPIEPHGQMFSFGTPVTWQGPVYGPASPSGVWAYDGRLIELTPRLLSSGVSVAEGWRLNTADVPDMAVSASDGAYYTVTSAGDSSANGVFHYATRSLSSGASKPDAALTGGPVTSLAANPGGGVLIVRGRTLQRWQPGATR